MLKKTIQILILINILLSGCVSVTVHRINSEKSLIEKRNDILTNGKLSDYTKTTMQLIGENIKKCEEHPLYCIEQLNNQANQISKDQLYSSLSELWMKQYFILIKDYNNIENNLQIFPLIESIRYAYAYLFLSNKSINDRTFDNRLNQIKDYYNYGTQQLSMIFYKILQPFIHGGNKYKIKIGKFNISFDLSSINKNDDFQIGYEMIPAPSVAFKGIRNIYFRDGIGAEFIISPNNKSLKNNIKSESDQDTVIRSITTIIDFNQANKQNINYANDLTLKIYDSYNVSNIRINNTNIKLAANFTASYGWWLSKSKFSSEAYLTFLRKVNSKSSAPKIYMMQPYNPNKKIIILLHGLLSSPEAWINLANDIMGTDNLRNNYQIWQVYYPTNLPIIINNFNIKSSINSLLNKLDPKREDIATKNIAIIGHSMGGIIARLLVSDYDITYLNNFLNNYNIKDNQRHSIVSKLFPYVVLKPLHGVNRVIFLATPHRGANSYSFVVQFIARNIISTIPNSIYNLIQSIFSQKTRQKKGFSNNIYVQDLDNINSIDSLNNKDPLMDIFYKNISIGKNIKYNSIIANHNIKNSIEKSNDGYIPWTSSHLDGAQSEIIVNYNHSVQNSPKAIAEIRRILELDISK